MLSRARFCALSFASGISLLFFVFPAVAQGPEKERPAPPVASVPPPITTDDPLLAPIPAAPKTLNTWREAMTLIETRAPDLRIAEQEVARAEGLSRQALGRALPTLSAGGTFTNHMVRTTTPFSACVGQVPLVNGTPGFVELQVPDGTTCPGQTFESSVTTPPSPVFTGQITARVPILSLRNWYAIGTADLNVEATKLSVSDRRRLLLANVASAIVNIVTAERTSEINRAGLRTSLERLELTKRRARLGTGTQLDVVRAEQDANLARNQIVQSDESLKRARESLGLALGDTVPYGVPPTITLDDIQQSVRSACTLGKPEDRADVLAAKTQLKIAERQVNESRLGFLPTADASTTFAATNQQQLQLNQPAYTWTIGAVLTVPIYEGTRYGELKSSRAAVESQKARVDAAERQAKLDAQQAVRAVEVQEQSLVISEKTRDLARETARLTQVAYEAGTATSFELVDSAQRLRQAELDLAVRELELIRAKIAALLASAVCEG